MSNSDEASNAEKRKEKLEVLRARRLSQVSASSEDVTEQRSTTSEVDSGPGKQGGLRKRFIKALAKRRQQGGEAASEESAAAKAGRGGGGMEAEGGKMPRMMKKKRAMLAKKKRMRRQRPAESGVDSSSTLEEISEHRDFLVARIDKLKTALDKRTAELKEVMALEAAQRAEDNSLAASDQADDSVKGS